MVVIIPSNRRLNLDYLSPLIEAGARFVVVDDSEGNITLDHPQFHVYNWGDRRKLLGTLDIGFPRKNGACRDFGFYVAWRESDPGEAIVALDDDCEVYHEDFASQVEKVLSHDARPVATCSGTHLNIIDLYDGAEEDVYPRGFPYSARVDYKMARFGAPESRQVVFSLGLWKSIFDVNAIDKIQGPQYTYPDVELKYPSVIIDDAKLVSVCSMNMHFRREVIPAVYQLPMHVEVMPGWVVDRYGDIWGGFILKTLMDIKGEAMAAGEPMINHLKEGNYIRNIWQEHTCHLINDEFLMILTEAREKIAAGTYLEMMQDLCDFLATRCDNASPLLKPYLQHLVTAMAAWNKALSQT